MGRSELRCRHCHQWYPITSKREPCPNCDTQPYKNNPYLHTAKVNNSLWRQAESAARS